VIGYPGMLARVVDAPGLWSVHSVVGSTIYLAPIDPDAALYLWCARGTRGVSLLSRNAGNVERWTTRGARA
jgi:hypothetical protein